MNYISVKDIRVHDGTMLIYVKLTDKVLDLSEQWFRGNSRVS